MKRLSLAVLALAPLALAACGSVKVTPSCAAAGKPRPSDCPLELLYKAPPRPYEPLAELQSHVTAVPPGGALEVLRPKACELGADAIIVEREQVLNEFGHVLVVGTAIRYRPPEPPPEAAPAPVPEPKAEPRPEPEPKPEPKSEPEPVPKPSP
jgi:outer membrane biosynthesis protein TonB